MAHGAPKPPAVPAPSLEGAVLLQEIKLERNSVLGMICEGVGGASVKLRFGSDDMSVDLLYIGVLLESLAANCPKHSHGHCSQSQITLFSGFVL